MTTDGRGYIKLPPQGPIQPKFAPLVREVVTTLTEQFPTLINSLYLYGSIARGQAVPGTSDLDITIIFHSPPSPQQQLVLDTLQRSLAVANPLVSKIDFDCGLRSEVLNRDNQYSWGYWLKHHCRCLYGEDLRDYFQPFKPSKAITIAVNGDFMPVVSGYLNEAQTVTDRLQRRLLIRAAARKLLRATDILRQEDDTDWPDSLPAYADKIKARFPQVSNEAQRLLLACQHATDFSDQQVAQIKAFAIWLEGVFTTPQ